MDHQQADSNRVSERLRAEQLALIYRQALVGQVFSPIAAAILCVILWPVADQSRLLTWLLVLVVISIVRQAIAMAYHRPSARQVTNALWERRFFISVAIAGLGWGIGGLLIMPTGLVDYELLIYCFQIGMASGTAAIYAAHTKSVALSISLIVGPTTIAFLSRGDLLHIGMALAAMLYVVAAIRSVRMLKQALLRSFALSHELEQLARTDPLSGLANRRAFSQLSEEAISNAARARRSCGILMIDIDHFKSVNDRFGHAAGDAVIRTVGHILTETVRRGESAGRIGGEEFAVLMPDATLAQGKALAERILLAIQKTPIAFETIEINVTASIGVAASDTWGTALTFETMLARADQALYAAKNSGRNRVVTTPTLTEPV